VRTSSLAIAGLVLAAVALVAQIAGGDPAGGAVSSVFFVAKSENRNQVHYGVRLDADCVPAGPQPVFAYWRMLEQGPRATEPLLSREQGAYGIAEQRVLDRRPDGGRVLVRLGALPDRPIAVETSRSEGACRADATTVIGGTPASLTRVFAQLRWPFGVDYLELTGRSLSDGRPVRERLAP
jgi:hypothetical protein